MRTAVDELGERGVAAAMVRPITVYPFPSAEVRLRAVAPSCKAVLVVEMSTGQMVEDVRYAVGDARPVHFYGRGGGNVPSPEEIARQVEMLVAPGAEVKP